MGFLCCLRFKEKRPDANRIGRCAPLSLVIQARKRGGFGVTARRTPAINGQASNKQKNLMRKHGVFLFVCCLPGNTHRGRMSAINGQASNQSEARPHRRAFCVLTRVITQMKQRIGSAMVVMIGSPANHKPHIRVKSYRLRVLLIHVGCESGDQSQSIHD